MRTIKGIGLDQSDAQHVMIAARNKCSVFLTFDVRTILRFTAELEKTLPLRFRSPTAYESEIRISGPNKSLERTRGR